MTDTALKQIAQIQKLPVEALREKWEVLFGTEAPAYSRPFLVKRLAYRIQELAHGGLSQQTRERVQKIAEDNGLDEMAALPQGQPKKKGMPVVGTRLIREWNGGRYEVIVVRDGFEFEGKKYRSLTAITKVITGTHWNGPAFFGLRQNGKAK
ncbi:MAG TPA: DUF2924 domain-containing protein [bacterium]|nr:DUF2924 domain-containing protein [bacterium]